MCTFNCIDVTDCMLVGGSNNWGDFYSPELDDAGGGVGTDNKCVYVCVYIYRYKNKILEILCWYPKLV